jgi:hypothetical protein
MSSPDLPAERHCGGVVGGRRLLKLTDRQYINAVRDLLGPIDVPAPQTPGSSDALFVSDADFMRVDERLASQYQRAAAAAGRSSDVGKLLACAAGEASEPCLDRWISGFGARAFRRPLGVEEKADLVALTRASRGTAPAAGARLVIEAVLQAPSFVYRTELGAGAVASDGRVALDPFELASALSFWLLDSIPDPPLWQDALAGTLTQPEVLRRHAARLLALPGVQGGLTEAVLRWLQTTGVLGASKDPKVGPFDQALREGLLEESRRFVADVLWTPGGTLQKLLTSNRTFIDARIAPLYGVAAPSRGGFVAVNLPTDQRAGILTHGSVLASHASPTEGSVVHRGLFVRGALLCQGVPPPPDGLDTVSPGQGLGERAAAEGRAANPSCKSCHALIDPFGLAFERYDAVGRYERSRGGATVDARARIQGTDFDGDVDGAPELARRLAGSQNVAACVAEQLLAHAVAREAIGDSCSRYTLEAQLGAGGTLAELLSAVAASDEFRFRNAKEEVR